MTAPGAEAWIRDLDERGHHASLRIRRLLTPHSIHVHIAIDGYSVATEIDEAYVANGSLDDAVQHLIRICLRKPSPGTQRPACDCLDSR